jgi:ABC-type transport system involved in multi-copper enzyme maturation permease subunit
MSPSATGKTAPHRVSALLSPRRFLTVLSADLAYHARRPMFLTWALILVLAAWGMSTGSMRIQSSDASVGGTKAWITSEFAVAFQLAVLTPLLYAFFVAVAAGMAIIQDDEWRLGDLVHATPLKPGEYVWGKFAAALLGGLGVLAVHLAAMIFFNHVLPNSDAKDVRGPFHLMNYLRPAFLFSLPTIVFLAGASLAVGERTRRTMLVFMLPLALVMVDLFFLWFWSPGWLDPRLNRALMWLDPGGFRWLNETWIKVDWGVSFYNSSPIPPDAGFLISRAVLVALGLGAVALSRRHFAATLRGKPRGVIRRAGDDRTSVLADEPLAVRGARPLTALGMTCTRPGLLAGAGHVARVELTELISSPGLYLFSALILLQTFGNALVRVGFLDTPLLITSGGYAMDTLNPLATCVCLLLLFYTVDSFERERSTRLASIAHATPVRTGSILLGKSAAQAVVGLAIILAAGLAGLIAILAQGRVPIEPRPVLLVWGLLLFPTLLLWSCFVMAVQTVTRNRYATYAVGLGVVAFTGYRLFTNQINWVGNWPLWNAASWSDISVLELDRRALVLSRVLAVGLAILCLPVTVRFFGRREVDPTRLIHRLRPGPLLEMALRLAPWAVIPLFTGTWLALEVSWGHEGGAAKRIAKDYWRKNLTTYGDVKLPDITHVDLDVELFPESGRFRVSGTYDLVNPADAPLREIVLTGGLDWENLSWTFDDKPYKPTDRSHLYVFTPTRPLARGQAARVGFRHEGKFPRGISKKGGAAMEFILPSGVVLTSFRPSFVPVLGFSDQIGIDDENRYEPKEYADDFYEGQTDSMLGSRAPFTTRIKLTGPAEFTPNSVGTKVEETVHGDRRTATWQSDHPVCFFNVVAGRWDVRRGEGTAVFHHPGHPYNVDEMLRSLDAARKYFSAWFYPYPWRELKLSEFPNLATYAQGFPTNITFSEGVGFLTQDSPEIHAAFEITAHEAAHQWWGNIVTPGKGPGGNILNEGTAHFSTILLVEQIKGLNARIDFCKRLEANYGKSRRPDSERPLVKTDATRPSDTTVMYDKGGWVFWMLLNQMGRERALEGIRAFFKAYHGNPDHPVLQDFVDTLRPFAADPAVYDAFTRQWFFEVALPEYRLHEPRKAREAGTWKATVRIENVGTGTMPVEVAAARGRRFDASGQPSADYQEVRAAVTLGKGESKEITITCPFEPDSLAVDPDAKVLQLQRKSAVASF